MNAILFWTLLVLLVVFLVRTMNRGSGHPHDAPGMSPPERVLAERFARGEIDEEEYRRRLGVLREEPLVLPSVGGRRSPFGPPAVYRSSKETSGPSEAALTRSAFAEMFVGQPEWIMPAFLVRQ
ncbi:SHOCT domain-containing protein [Streptomyces chiangmaiensis]